jgi:hypothetical protein
MICNETDYLQAHLTVIEGKSRGWNLTLYNLKQQLTSGLKKWILAAKRKPDSAIQSTAESSRD